MVVVTGTGHAVILGASLSVILRGRSDRRISLRVNSAKRI